jgi:hypothetical protein
MTRKQQTTTERAACAEGEMAMSERRAALGFALAALLVSASQAVEIDLTLDPGLKLTKTEGADGKMPYLTATLPLGVEKGVGRVVELDYTLLNIWFGSPLQMGVKSADGKSEILLHFEKCGWRDHFDNECRLYLRRNGSEKLVATAHGLYYLVKFRLILKWTADGKVEFIVRQGLKELFKVSADMADASSPDEFFMRVMNKDENGYIAYDHGRSGFFMRMYPGGAYAVVDYLSTKAIKQGGTK